MKFNYHAWATRNVRPGARKYTVREHCLYVAVSLLMLVICVVILYCSVRYLVGVFAGGMAASGNG